MLCSRIDRGTGAFGFTFLGTTAAVFVATDGEAPRLVKLLDVTPDSTDPQQVNWGAAATAHGGWYFVYGTRLTGRPGEIGRELYVARAPAADPRTRSGWRFWDGRSWQRHAGRAAAVLPAAGGVSQTLSVDVVGGEFVAVSKRDGDLSNFVYKWTAPDPGVRGRRCTSSRRPAGSTAAPRPGAAVRAAAHPEIALASGRLLVSVSRNTTDVQRLLEDPQLGRPRFVELPGEASPSLAAHQATLARSIDSGESTWPMASAAAPSTPARSPAWDVTIRRCSVASGSERW